MKTETLEDIVFFNTPEACAELQSRLAQGLTAQECHTGLITAIRHQRTQSFDILFPHCDPTFNDREAFKTAVVSGTDDMVRQLFAHHDPKANHWGSLMAACVMEKEYLIDLLYPLSDVAAAKKYMEESKLYAPYAKHLMVRMNAQNEREMIEQHMPEKTSSKRKVL